MTNNIQPQQRSGGTFYDKTHEILIVKDYLISKGVEWKSIYTCKRPNDGDVVVALNTGQKLIVEVKEELAHRWMKYHELGIDGISSFIFKTDKADKYWKKHPYGHHQYLNLLKDIDLSHRFKLGKLSYSKADLWLFAGYNYDGGYDFLECYRGYDITSKAFKNFILTNCAFAVNQKTEDNSKTDTWNSLVWFVKPEDMPKILTWKKTTS